MKALCINLDHRTDRWESAQKLIKENGFDVERFSATEMKPGWMGCAASHLRVLESINEFPFAVFEDDLEFINPIEVMHKAIEQAGDFDMLYLGCDPQDPMVKADETLLRLGLIYQTHAIIYGSKRVVDFILSKRDEIRKIDVFFGRVVTGEFKCFATNPMVCKQSDGFSDITNKKVNFDYIQDKYNSMIQ